MPSSPRRTNWLFASVVFSVVGGLATILLLWSAARGRSGAAVSSVGVSYREEAVRFQAGEVQRTGRLFQPKKRGPYPVVVFIRGAGAADDAGNRDLPAIAQHLAGQGFASFVADPPAAGASTDAAELADFSARAAEMLAAVRTLRERADVRKDQVGLLGFGTGAAVAPLAASQLDGLAFVIAVSGSPLPIWKQELHRAEAEMRADGFAEKAVTQAMEFAQMRMDLMRGSGLFEELDETQKGLAGRPWFDYFHYCDRPHFEAAQRIVGFEPSPYWEKVHCPVLAVFGAQDTALPAESSADGIGQALTTASNRDVTVKVFPHADHRITVTTTGGPKEAVARAKARPASAGPEFAPGYLDTMSAWLGGRFAAQR